MKSLSRLLVTLHPQDFRRRFGGELLAILEEAPAAAPLLTDLGLSLFRHWVLRRPLWRVALILVCAALPLLFSLALAQGLPRLIPAAADGLNALSPVGFFVMVAVATLVTIAFTLILTLTWPRIRRTPRRC